MKVLIFGSRKWNGRSVVYSLLDELLTNTMANDLFPLVVMEGGAAGVDRFAREWCEEMAGDGHGVVWEPHPAAWNEHHPDWCDGTCAGSRKERPYCSLAGFRRNQEMADAKPDCAFGWGETNGTMDMRDRLYAAGVPTARFWKDGAHMRSEANDPWLLSANTRTQPKPKASHPGNETPEEA